MKLNSRLMRIDKYIGQYPIILTALTVVVTYAPILILYAVDRTLAIPASILAWLLFLFVFDNFLLYHYTNNDELDYTL